MAFGGGLTFKRINATAVTAGMPQTIWTRASGLRFRVIGQKAIGLRADGTEPLHLRHREIGVHAAAGGGKA